MTATDVVDRDSPSLPSRAAAHRIGAAGCEPTSCWNLASADTVDQAAASSDNRCFTSAGRAAFARAGALDPQWLAAQENLAAVDAMASEFGDPVPLAGAVVDALAIAASIADRR